MILNFPTEQLREICEKRNVATAVLGEAAARELAEKLADMDACETAAEFFALHPNAVVDLSPAEKALRFAATHKLTFRSGHPTFPELPEAATNWSEVKRLRIVSIEAFNG